MKALIKRSTLNGLLIGAGSVLNIFPGHAAEKTYGRIHEPDTQVLKSDWKAIGGDFNTAIKKIKKK